MIDVKIIKKPKSGNSKSTIRVGGGFSSSGMAGEAKHANSADKANYADKAGHSDSAGYANQAGQSTRANYADVAEDISESSPIYDRFLRKDIDDTARGLITFLKGLVAQAVSYFKGIANTGDITNTGNFRNDGNISNTGDITNTGNFRNDGNITNTGDIVTRNLRVTEKATFFQLEIQKAKAAGGMTVHSAGTFHIDAVEEATDTDGYVCYQRAEQDGVKLSQMCEVSDQMMCSNGMNILKGGNGNHFYWRKVTEAPKEVVTHVINGKEEKCLKIVLSKIDHSDNTVDIPQVGDDLVQIGNPDNKERQSVIMTCAYNSFDPDLETPYWVQYTGVNDYKLETHKRTWFARNGSHVTGNFKVQSDNGGEESIEDYMKGLASKNIALSYKLIPISENALAYFTEDKKEKKVALKLKYKIQKSIGGQVSFTTLTAEGMTLTLQPSVDMLFKYDKGAYSLEKSGMVYVEIPDNSYIVTLTKGSNIVDQRIVPITFKPKVVFDIDTELGKVSSDISTVDGRVSSFEQDIEKTKSTVGNLSKDFTQIKQTSEEISLTVNNGTRPNLLWGSDLNLDGVQDKIELAYDQGGIIKQKTAEKEDLQRQLDATPTYDTSRRNELQSRIDACNDDIITARNRVNECKAAIEKHLGVGLGDTILSSTHFKYLKGQGINGSDALYFKCDPQDNNVLYLGTFWERSVGGLRNIKVKRNTKYTVSVWIKYASRDDGKWGACYCEAHAKNSDTDGNRRASYTVEDAYQTEPVEEWTRREFKFTTGEYDYAAVNILTASAGIREMWLCRPKLEESDKATPWCEYDGTEEGLRRAGIYLKEGKIKALGDQFEWFNNKGERKVYFDNKTGNYYFTGDVNATTFTGNNGYFKVLGNGGAVSTGLINYSNMYVMADKNSTDILAINAPGLGGAPGIAFYYNAALADSGNPQNYTIDVRNNGGRSMIIAGAAYEGIYPMSAGSFGYEDGEGAFIAIQNRQKQLERNSPSNIVHTLLNSHLLATPKVLTNSVRADRIDANNLLLTLAIITYDTTIDSPGKIYVCKNTSQINLSLGSPSSCKNHVNIIVKAGSNIAISCSSGNMSYWEGKTGNSVVVTRPHEMVIAICDGTTWHLQTINA